MLGFAALQSGGQATDQIAAQLRQSDASGALSLANSALTRNPESCPLLSLKGIAQMQLGQEEPALQTFKHVLALCSNNLAALEGAAQIEYAQRDPGTTALLKRLLRLDPSNVTAHAMLASTDRSRGDCKSALPHYEAVRSLFGSRTELSQGYASCLAREGRYTDALAAYRGVNESHSSQSTRYSIAWLEWKTRDNEGALKQLAGLAMEGYQSALSLEARIDEDQGNTPAAIDILRRAIVLNPDNPDNYLEFATVAFSHNSFQVGLDMLNSGISRLSTSAPLFVARGVMEVQLGRDDDAMSDFERAHQLDSKLSFAIDAIGIMHSQQHEDSRSLAFFRSQTRLHPDDPFLQFLLAERLAEAETDGATADLANAIAAAKTAVSEDPTYIAARDLLAALYVRSKQFSLAIDEAERALAQEPNDQSALYQEILASRRMGNSRQVSALVARLQSIRKENKQREETSKHYILEDNPNP